MRTRTRFWTLLFALLLPGVAPAKTALFPPERFARIQQGIRAIYDMDYARAARNFQDLIDASPDDPAGFAYLAMTCWIQELSGTQELSIDRFASSDFFTEAPRYRPKVDPGREKTFREANDRAIEKAQALLKRNPQDRAALFLRGLAYQNLASFEATLKRRWWASVLAGTKTFKDHGELLRLDPEFHDARLSVGVREYVAGSIPWHLKWLAILLGQHGSKEEGKRQLRLAAEKALLAADDAKTILILIYTRERNYAAAMQRLSELREKYPRNYLVPLDMAGILLLMKKPEKAIAIYEELLHDIASGPSKYEGLERALLYNRMGVALRQKGDLENAGGWFERALADSSVSVRTATVARLELGKTMDLMSKRHEALRMYRLVAEAEDFAGSRTEADQLLKRPFRR